MSCKYYLTETLNASKFVVSVSLVHGERCIDLDTKLALLFIDKEVLDSLFPDKV